MSGHYFESQPSSSSRPTRVALRLPDLRAELLADAGVFSAEGVDPGTDYLLREAARPPDRATTLLDLGCGYGPIAVTLAARAPQATVWAVDVNERALGLCERNADALALANVRTVTPDDLPDDLRFDAIYSNPPIRIGKRDLHALLGRWLPRLSQWGHAELVVSKHLGADSLARWLAREGWRVARLGSRRGYRILRVERPDTVEPAVP